MWNCRPNFYGSREEINFSKEHSRYDMDQGMGEDLPWKREFGPMLWAVIVFV